ncbi:MAG: hypothetical protein R6V41_03055 [Desulfobacteraceae bacterium]
MKKTMCFIAALMLVSILFNPAAAANPFEDDPAGNQKVQAAPKEVAFDGNAWHTVLLKITMLQQTLKIKMTGLIKDFQNGSSILPLLSALAVSFLYGVLHAAGPGHGKAFASAYILSERPSISKGVALGNLLAFFHGMSGAFTVLALHFLLSKTVSGTVSEIEHITRITSYSLLCLLGAVLVVKSLAEIRSKASRGPGALSKNMLVWGFSAGIVPCPGVVMIMLFCLSFGLPYLGVALSVFVSAGMAVTISLVVVAVTMGKKMSFAFLPDEKIEAGEQVLAILSGLFVLSAGAVFLISALTHGKTFL